MGRGKRDGDLAFGSCGFFFRTLATDPAKAKEWTEGLRFYFYGKRANPQANKILTPNGKTWSQMQPRGMAYWVRLAEILNQEPIQPRDRVMMGMLKPLGIERGKPFEPSARQKKLLEEAALVGEAMAKSITFANALMARSTVLIHSGRMAFLGIQKGVGVLYPNR